MPSFDVVSEVDAHELTNVVDQANRELTNRFDFKGIEASFTEEDQSIVLQAPAEFQLQQMRDILTNKLIKRGLDVSILDEQEPDVNLSKAKLVCKIKQGLEKEAAKKLVSHIKNTKLKVQAAINGDKVRITGAKRDDLQAVIAQLKQLEFEQPLQFNNFRD